MRWLEMARSAPPLAAILLLSSATLPADVAPGGKTHTLFMGADISVGYKNGVYPVQDVLGSTWLIDVAGERRQVATRDQHVDIRTTPIMKLTRGSAAIFHLLTERGYTMDNDPSVRITRDLADSAKLNFSYQVFNNQVAAIVGSVGDGPLSGMRLAASTMAISDLRELMGSGAAVPSLATNGQPSAAQNEITTNSAGGNAGPDVEMYGRRGLSLGFDAMHVSFDVAADHVIRSPYIVTFTRFREKNAKPNEVKMLIYAAQLHEIDRRQQSVDIVEGGFPPEFEMIGFQLHLYEGRKEIATNVAPKRVELTGDEAFEYLKMDYLAAHKGETLAARPLMGTLPGNFPEMAKSVRFSKDLYVRVSKDGMAEGAYRDSLGTMPVNDPDLDEILRNIRFQPSLEKGTPVEGLAPLNLRHLEL
jgi:hypothetical protein